MLFSKKLSLSFISCIISSSAFAHSISTNENTDVVVGSKSCTLHIGIEKPFLFIIKRGDSVREEIAQCIKNAHIKGAAFSGGVGAMNSLELGYYDVKQQSYNLKTFNNPSYEVLALNGNVSKIAGKNEFFVHAHGVFADNNYHVFGGHINKGKASITVELLVNPLNSTPFRTKGNLKSFNPITKFK